MRAPRFDRKIRIQKQNTNRSADGSVATGWTDFAVVWAAKKDVAASRRGQTFGSSTFSDTLFSEYTIRYMVGLDGSERVVEDNGLATKSIGLPAESGDRREYLIITTERGAIRT